jgi:predicted RNase H-like HicB family nuclease
LSKAPEPFLAQHARTSRHQRRAATEYTHLSKYRDILKMIEKDGWRQVTRSGPRHVEQHPQTGRAKTMKYIVIYEKTSTGYSCYAPDLPGCIAAGDDISDTKALMERAIEMHLAGLREDGDPIPEPTTAAEYLEVPAA